MWQPASISLAITNFVATWQPAIGPCGNISLVHFKFRYQMVACYWPMRQHIIGPFQLCAVCHVNKWHINLLHILPTHHATSSSVQSMWHFLVLPHSIPWSSHVAPAQRLSLFHKNFRTTYLSHTTSIWGDSSVIGNISVSSTWWDSFH